MEGFATTRLQGSEDSKYRQMISFDQYDNPGNLQQFTPIDQNPVTIIWDYVHDLPIAQVKNAGLADVAAMRFEADGTGNWTYTGTASAIVTDSSDIYVAGEVTNGGTFSAHYWKNGTDSLLDTWPSKVSITAFGFLSDIDFIEK